MLENIAANGVEIDAGSDTDASPKHGTVRLKTLRDLDGRTRAARRARDLAKTFEAELGADLTDVRRLRIAVAAGLVAVSEDAVTRRLRGEAVPLDDVVRAVSCARRAMRDIGLDLDQKSGPTPPSLAEYLSKREAAE